MATEWSATDVETTLQVVIVHRVTPSGLRHALIWSLGQIQPSLLLEEYACADSGDMFVADFVAAWAKVMNADRFDLA